MVRVSDGAPWLAVAVADAVLEGFLGFTLWDAEAVGVRVVVPSDALPV